MRHSLSCACATNCFAHAHTTGTSESGFLKFEKWKVKIKSFHSFSRSAKWKKMLSLFFEKCKVKSKCFHSFSRSEKWNQNASRSRSRSENSREFLTILEKRDFLTDLFRDSQIRLLKQMACLWGNNHEHLICPIINMLCIPDICHFFYTSKIFGE